MDAARDVLRAACHATLAREYAAWAAMLAILILYVAIGGDRFPAVLATGLFTCVGLAFIQETPAPP